MAFDQEVRSLKPIIIDMKDLSDSVELYESRPNPAIIGFIYVLLALLASAVIWMTVSKMEVVIKSNGMFRGENKAVEVGCEFTGKVAECNVRDGQLVQKGDMLFSLESIGADDSMEYYQEELENVKDRLEILTAYAKYLDGDEDALDGCAGNQYALEISNRKDLLLANVDAAKPNDSSQTKTYQDNIKVMRETLKGYEEKKTKLEAVIEAIKKQSNPFGEEDAYYASILSSYLSGYVLTASQYDAKLVECSQAITDYDKLLEELEKKRKDEEERISASVAKAETGTRLLAGQGKGSSEGTEEATAKDGMSGDEVDATQNHAEANDTATAKAVEANTVDDTLLKQLNGQIEEANRQKADVTLKINAIVLEKEKALSTMELQQIASIEQQIETISGNIQSVQASIATTENQIKALDDPKEEGIKERYFLTEKGNVQAEILTYQAKQKELENATRQRSLLNEKSVVTADATGYFYLGSEVRIGSYLQAGSRIGSIYPEEETEYHADVYVSNADVGKIHEGQEVKFEIAAYPSSEFGYFTGRVKSIAKDISVDQGSGNAYYLVEVECDATTLRNKDGKTASLMNGLACQAKIVTGEEKVLWYLLRKIDLLD